MATQLQIRRGTSSQVAAFTGAEGEIVVNTTNDSIVVSDGSTAGGFEMARADLNNVSDTSLNAALTGNTVSALTVTSLTSSGINVTGTVTADGATLALGSVINFSDRGNLTHNASTYDMTFNTNSFANALVIKGTGNVGIGTSSPSSVAKLQVEDITASNTSTYISVVSGNGGNAGIIFGDSDSDLRGGVLYNNADNALRFFGKNAFSEAGRFDVNGNFLVGTTSASGSGVSSGKQVIQFAGASVNGLYLDDTRTSSGIDNAIVFGRGATYCGKIETTTAPATNYVSASDQRLKSNIADADDAGSKIDAIQVRKYDWIGDGTHQEYGLVAQELQPIAPLAVSGDADSEDMMGVDYSKLVPMLIKEIQSLRARVQQLENN